MELRGHVVGKLRCTIALWVCSIVLAVANSPGNSELSKILQEYQDAQQKWQDGYKNAKTDEERSALKYPSAEDYAPRVLAVAKKYPDDPAAFDALVWVAQNCRRGSELDVALPLLLERYSNEAKTGDVALHVLYASSKEIEPFLRGIAEKSSKNDVKGKALLTLGRVLKERVSIVKDLRSNPEPQNMGYYRNRLGEEVVEKLKAADPAAVQKEAEKTFETVVAKYSKEKGASRTLGESAKGELFEMRNLQIGMTAPEIKGADVDGKKFALTDHRGKVVVLDFWGHW